VPIDRPDEYEAARVEERVPAPDRVSAETRDPATYESELRAAVAADRWETAKAHFTERWSAHQTDHPPSPSHDDPRGLDPAADAQVGRACDRVRDIEQRVITPAMRDIESEDPDRSLVGLDHRLKGPDRLKEKVADYLWADPDATAGEAVSMVSDTVRFTFCYADERYAAGVSGDLDRLEAHGFELVRPLKNYWEADRYKGINSQWREPDSGVRFEVQFHTQVSFEAKQLTHGVYERLRSRSTEDAERPELDGLQRAVCARIPVPQGAAEIERYPRREHDG
jgi:hypothetical protein